MRLASPNIVSDEARIGFNGVREGYCFCGEACAKTSAPKCFFGFSHIYFSKRGGFRAGSRGGISSSTPPKGLNISWIAVPRFCDGIS